MDHTVNFSATPPPTGQAWSPPARRPLLGRFPAWRLGEDGVSAVEFAMLAPILFFALLATVDLGLALFERMTIDHVLRAGAQTAMADEGVDKVQKVLEATGAKNFTLAGAEADGTDALDLSVVRYCACPEKKSVAVACSTTCSGPASTFIYYHLSGEKNYQGIILPPISFGPSIQIQIR